MGGIYLPGRGGVAPPRGAELLRPPAPSSSAPSPGGPGSGEEFPIARPRRSRRRISEERVPPERVALASIRSSTSRGQTKETIWLRCLGRSASASRRIRQLLRSLVKIFMGRLTLAGRCPCLIARRSVLRSTPARRAASLTRSSSSWLGGMRQFSSLSIRRGRARLGQQPPSSRSYIPVRVAAS